MLVIAHLRRQYYQYCAFASSKETGKVIKDLAITEFYNSRDTGRLIVNHFFVLVFLTSLVPSVLVSHCFVGLRGPSPYNFEGCRAKTVYCTGNNTVHQSLEWKVYLLAPTLKKGTFWVNIGDTGF